MAGEWTNGVEGGASCGGGGVEVTQTNMGGRAEDREGGKRNERRE